MHLGIVQTSFDSALDFHCFSDGWLLPYKGGEMFGWHCLGTCSQAMVDEQNTDDDSRNHQAEVFQVFFSYPLNLLNPW